MLEGRFPTLDATRISISRSKVRVTRPINADTHCAPYLPNGKVYELQIWYTDGGRQGHMIGLSRVGMAHKSKTNSRSITKIGRRVPHDTFYIAHQFQGQKVKGQGHRSTNADTQNVPYFPNGKAQELQSLCVDGWRRPASAASAMTSKVKRQDHKVTWYVRLDPCGYTMKFALGTLTKYQDVYDWQSRWPPRSKVKVISSHHLYVSSLPLLNSGNKMLYLCH